LRKIATKFRQRERWKHGLGMTPDELAAAFDPDVALGLRGHRPAVEARALVAEAPVKYGKKRSR
jgi:hypothetical protein